jgi:transglutaminase-like putative cysteine protease
MVTGVRRAPTQAAGAALLPDLVLPILLFGLLIIPSYLADQIYSGTLLLILLAGAAAGSLLVSVVCIRLPAWSVAPISTVALAGYLAYTLQLAAGRAQIPGDLPTIASESLRDGIPRLLAALIPVEPQPDTVAVPIVATWLAGLAAAELAVRGRRVLLGLTPPTLLLAGAAWLVGPARAASAGPALWPSMAYAALAVALLAVSGRVRTPQAGVDPATRRALRLRSAVTATLGVTLVSALVLGVGPLLAGGVRKTPIDPRTYVVPPQVDAYDENPLIRLSGWALQPQERLLDTTLDADGRIRLAVLSDYDGVTWRVGATYRPAGRTMPDSAGSLPQQAVRQTITIAGLTGKLLPAVGTPRQVDGLRVAYDQSSGTLIHPDGLSGGMTYTVTSRYDDIDVNLLPGAQTPEDASMARYIAIGAGVPQSIQALAQRLGAENGAPYQRARAIEQFLSEHYRLDSQAPSGHAYPNLDFFLFGPIDAGGQRGTSEQFAASFAVLARLLNLPSRVVVGFAAKAGNHPVTAGDAFAWPEVYFQDLGWVAFSPLPEPQATPRPLEEEFRPKPEQSSPPPVSEAPVPTLSAAAPSIQDSQGGGGAAAGGTNVAMIAGVSAGSLLLLAAVVLVIALLLARSALRRRRLDADDPTDRVSGAWLEVNDALRLAGQPAPPHLSAVEVSAHAAEAAANVKGRHTVRRAAPPIDGLAQTVNDALFGPARADEAAAGQATAQAVAFVTELKARRSWWCRLLWTLHPGPIRWQRRR